MLTSVSHLSPEACGMGTPERYARSVGTWTLRGAQPLGGRRNSIFRVKALELESLDEAG